MFFTKKKVAFSDDRPIFNAKFCQREFKSHLILCEEFISWLNAKNLYFDDKFQILDRKFVQVEFFLYAVTLNSTHGILKGRLIFPKSRRERVRGIRKAIRAASIQWRELLRAAISKGEIVLYDYLSRLPVESPRDTKEIVSAAEVPIKTLTSTERNTLLIMIAALCVKAGINAADSKAAGQIERLIDQLGNGSRVTDETIRKHLDKIPGAMASRGR